MAPALEILVLVGVVAVVAGLARRFDRPEPLVLVLVGIALSFVPPFPDIALTPDLVLVGFLPPLLYAAAIRSSLIDFRANKRVIILLSVGLVGFSTVVVGLVSWWVIPGASLAAGMCLGAVVAPPDAVAATAVGRRVGMPRQMVAVLDGESLINDATALVALNTSIAALSGTVSPWGVGWDFLRAAGGGLLVGLAVGYLLGAVRRRIDDVVLDTTLSLAAPYLAFIPAQELDSSGVLAVVVTG
ncbi:MAG: monovalent cation/hydrogen antiporter, partial [Frankiales bacterium]|nr:monovalent cation/hydrogen antiporter [Frankiales bacterium]